MAGPGFAWPAPILSRTLRKSCTLILSYPFSPQPILDVLKLTDPQNLHAKRNLPEIEQYSYKSWRVCAVVHFDSYLFNHLVYYLIY